MGNVVCDYEKDPEAPKIDEFADAIEDDAPGEDVEELLEMLEDMGY